MRVDSIKFYNINQISSGYNQTKYQTSPLIRSFDQYPIGYMQHQINFGASATQVFSWPRGLIELKLRGGGLPCLYCGEKMVPRPAFDAIASIAKPKARARAVKSFLDAMSEIQKTLSPEDRKVFQSVRDLFNRQEQESYEKSLLAALKREGYEYYPNIKYSREIIKSIRHFEDTMTPIARDVFAEIKSYHKRHIDATLQETMAALRPKHLKILDAAQMGVLDNIEAMITGLSDESRQKVLKIINDARNTINAGDILQPFKRKNFIKRLIGLKEEIPEKQILTQIEQEAFKLPSSGDNVSAFIVKYSGVITGDVIEEIPEADFEENLSAAEKAILAQIKEKYGEKYPDKTIQEIIDEISHECQQQFIKKQNETINDLNSNAQDISKQVQDTASRIIQDITAMDEQTNPSMLRQSLLNNLRELRVTINGESLQTIFKKAQKMPYAENNDEAWVLENFEMLEKIQAKKKHSGEERKILARMKEYYRNHYGLGRSKELAEIKLSQDSAQKVHERILDTVQDIRALVEDESLSASIIRQRLVKKLKELKSMMSNEGFQAVLSKAQEMPCAKNDNEVWLLENLEIFDDIKLDANSTIASPETKKKLAQNISKRIRRTVADITQSIRAMAGPESSNPSALQQNLFIKLKELESMLNNESFQEILGKVQKMPSAKNDEDAWILENLDVLKAINPNKNIPPETKKIIERMQEYIKGYSNGKFWQKDIDQLPEDIVVKLTQKQNSIISELNSNAQNVSKRIRKIAANITQDIKPMIGTEPSPSVIKQKLFSDLKKLSSLLGNNSLNIILNKAQKMPDGQNSAEVWILENAEAFNSLQAIKNVPHNKRRIISRMNEYVKSFNQGKPLQGPITNILPEIKRSLEQKQNLVLDAVSQTIEQITGSFESDVLQTTNLFVNQAEPKKFVNKVKQMQTPLNKFGNDILLAPLSKLSFNNTESLFNDIEILQYIFERISPEIRSNLEQKQNAVLNSIDQAVDKMMNLFEFNISNGKAFITKDESKSPSSKSMLFGSPLNKFGNEFILSPYSALFQDNGVPLRGAIERILPRLRANLKQKQNTALEAIVQTIDDMLLSHFEEGMLKGSLSPNGSEIKSTHDRTKVVSELPMYEEESLQDAIKKLFPEIKSKLAQRQKTVLDETTQAVKEMMDDFEFKVLQSTITFVDNPDQKKIFIKMKQLQTPLNEQQTKFLLEPLSQRLQSRNDISAFVLKYATSKSNLDNEKTLSFVQRSDKEIAQSLLAKSVYSVEHLRPKELFTDIQDANVLKNLALVHQHCNEEKTNILLADYIEKYPEIIQNAQKYVDYIIEMINNGKLLFCDDYPAELKATLYTESKGKINLDISRLKIHNH